MRSKPRAAAGAGACDLRVPQPGRVSADRQVLLEQVSLPLPLLFGPPNYGEANYFNKVRYTTGEGALLLFFFFNPEYYSPCHLYIYDSSKTWVCGSN